MQRIRKSGPKGVARPFVPTVDIGGSMKPDEQAAEALEHIAVALSSIDHNLEAMVGKMDGLLRILAQQK